MCAMEIVEWGAAGSAGVPGSRAQGRGGVAANRGGWGRSQRRGSRRSAGGRWEFEWPMNLPSIKRAGAATHVYVQSENLIVFQLVTRTLAQGGIYRDADGSVDYH
jgi:hypothetical protein